MEELRGSRPDGIAFVGDATCDGDEAVYDWFLQTVGSLGIPVVYIPGNSDLRRMESRESIRRKASPCMNRLGDVVIYAINDSDGRISEEQLGYLEQADARDVVLMHHPLAEHRDGAAEALSEWRLRHPEVTVFYGHLHEFWDGGATVCLPAMDPDKSIGEAPCLVYYDTDTRGIRRCHYPVSVPEDLAEYFGISCRKPCEQVAFARERGLRYLELRTNCAGADPDALEAQVAAWRREGGVELSIHLPDVGYENGAVVFEEPYDDLLALAIRLKAVRLTQHVPKVSVGAVARDPAMLDRICEAIAERLARIPYPVTVGVENMHMTAGEVADESRRFGYVPEECLAFMEALGARSSHRVGINFDIGHARNNAPFSKAYPIGTWLSLVGKHAVGYHMHQVTHENGKFRNHMPFTHLYGSLISLASFFGYWESGRIRRCPVIFEMRPEDAYAVTLDLFEKELSL
jgi:hypothetical protein